MKKAQIELTNYFVSELHFAANRGFDAAKPFSLQTEDIQATEVATSRPDNPHDWQVSLKIILNTTAEKNVPYSLSLEMVGFFQVDNGLQAERIERIVRINGASMLYSAAREIAKAATSRGPFRPILLPTVTFWEPKPQVEPTEKSPELQFPTE